tara:strand:- start:549 stop:1433 length:885 start_codon:yes stop_codon:yes gene_type:complete
MAKRINYLNNKDILKEIHKSKGSYCYYVDEKFAFFDFILVDPIEKMNKTKLLQARRNRADRLTKLKAEELGLSRGKIPTVQVKLKEVLPEDVVVRCYGFDHIPDDPGRKAKPKTVADTKVKLNFIPFKHYVLKDDVWTEVGRSHWVGGLENGHFSLEHGKMTNKLALMFMKLCERYGSRGNWRGYTYNDEMRSQALLQLSQIGLQFDESKSENPFAYYTAAITNSFTRILNVEKKHQSLRDDILQAHGQTPSFTRQMENESKAMGEEPMLPPTIKRGWGANRGTKKAVDKNAKK